MNYKIPNEKIAQVREATDIVALISNYLTLKKSGKRFVGLCPFHSDSSPSFYVNPESQLYYCFGCQKGGNVYNFLMEIEKISFTEAVEFLAQKAGISLPKTPVDDRVEKEKEALYYVNRWAANFFYKNLLAPVGNTALAYIEGRGISREIIKIFGLGYSLPDWDGLVKQAQSDAVSIDVLYKAGLIIKKDSGGYYDRFRNRFMIPIVDLYKNVLGFGGRKLAADESPKYINSPETPIYKKGQILFGLYQSREAIKKHDQAIFVEGYMDMISLFQAGIYNVVATSGTALTSAQAQLIRRYTQNIILIYDADAAGSSAAMRGADIFLDEGLEVKMVTLPAGHDPDSLVRERGVDYFRQVISRAKSIVQFKIDTLTPRLDLTSTQGKTQLINSLLESILRIKNSIKQNLTLKEVAEYFRLDERALMEQLQHLKKNERIRPVNTEKSYEINKQVALKQKSKYDIAEEDLVRLVLEDTTWLSILTKHLILDEISDPKIRQLFSVMYQLYQTRDNVNPQMILNEIVDPQMSATVAELLTIKYNGTTDRKKLINDCLVRIKKRKLENILSNLENEIKIAQEKQLDATDYIKKYLQYQAEIKKIDSKDFVNTMV